MKYNYKIIDSTKNGWEKKILKIIKSISDGEVSIYNCGDEQLVVIKDFNKK
jgi:hypothetical protein